MIKEALTQYREKFSRNQQDLADKIGVRLGKDVATCLVSLLMFERTSKREIGVIAKFIEQFKPLEVSGLAESPYKIKLTGLGPKDHRVDIFPQFKLKNPLPNGRVWSLDLVVKLYRQIGDIYFEICAINMEYDGDPSHYLESGVKKSYVRDVAVASELFAHVIRVSPEEWERDSQYFIKAVKKLFENSIRRTEKLQRYTLECSRRYNASLGKAREIKCPICTGLGMLADDFCPLCKGVGFVNERLVFNLDVSDYECVDCPECKKRKEPYRACKICKGTGSISRDKAIEIAKERV